jgi:hypothetical protein
MIAPKNIPKIPSTTIASIISFATAYPFKALITVAAQGIHASNANFAAGAIEFTTTIPFGTFARSTAAMRPLDSE